MDIKIPITPAPDDVEDLTSSVLVRRYGGTVVIGTDEPITLTGRQAVQLYEAVTQAGPNFLAVGQFGLLAVLDANQPGVDAPPANRMQYECHCGWACVDDTGDAAGFNDVVDEHLDAHEREDQT